VETKDWKSDIALAEDESETVAQQNSKTCVAPDLNICAVIPAKAGIQVTLRNWIPAFAGMTALNS
jgi:hypothetical protein